VGSPALSELRHEVIDIVARKGRLELPERVQLASGDMSKWFVDGKRALCAGADLRTACEAFVELAEVIGAGDFNAVGGLTLGADQFAHGIALVKGCDWFVVRKAAKGRGTNRRIEGADIAQAGRKVLLVDDVVTRGGSIEEAFNVIRDEGATIVGAVTLVDRGGHADAFFEREGVPYAPVVHHWEIGIPAVGEE
jgi:orotate phosphoribosyltransferase